MVQPEQGIYLAKTRSIWSVSIKKGVTLTFHLSNSNGKII